MSEYASEDDYASVVEVREHAVVIDYGNSDYTNTTNNEIRLLSCPAPGCDFRFHKWEPREDHIASHSPEDFGLSPMVTKETTK